MEKLTTEELKKLVYNLFIIWNVNTQFIKEVEEYVDVYNLFIIWNVNTQFIKEFEEYVDVYNLFIIWNVNKQRGTVSKMLLEFIICSLYEM